MAEWREEVERRGRLLDAIHDELSRANEIFFIDQGEAHSRLQNALGLATDAGVPRCPTCGQVVIASAGPKSEEES